MARFMCIFLAISLMISRSAISAPSCNQVVNQLTPCLSYLQGSDPTPQCCQGVNEMKNSVKTRDDRIAACNCGKKALSQISYDPNRLPLLSSKCGIENFQLPPIDKNYDCSKVE